MRQNIKKLLENLPKGYRFDGEKLEFQCDRCGVWLQASIRSENIFEGEHLCRPCAFKRRDERRMQRSALQAQETLRDFPWMQIDVPTRKVECRCADCGTWFEVNYFHDTSRFLSTDQHFCKACHGKCLGRGGSRAKHDKFMRTLQSLVEQDPKQYKMDGERLLCVCELC